jgi:hypothetical protein
MAKLSEISFLILGLVLFFIMSLSSENNILTAEKREKDFKIKSVISGCSVFPNNNIWNTPIDNLPVDPNSNLYINAIGSESYLHADFGSGTWNGGPIGIPYTTVPGTQPKVDVTFYYEDESDPGPYPIPPDAPIEGGPDSTGDRHVLVLDRDNCLLYELYDAYPQTDGSWTAGSGAIFNLSSHALRPAGWTSADAAGLPILPGLVRYDEVAAGEIKHAIRVTAPQTRREYIWPARHFASSLTGIQYPPMGQRFRLKSDFDVSSYSRDCQVILTALKKYGMILADNGASWFISGVPDERWDNDVLHQLHNVKGSDFEAVDESSLMIDPDSGEALQLNPTVRVTSPNGGEDWIINSIRNITWTANGLSNSLYIVLKQAGEKVALVGKNIDPDSGSYEWKVGSCLKGTVEIGSNYKILVVEKITHIKDESDSSFTISLPPITVTSPNGGEDWALGTSQEINWTVSGVTDGLHIILIQNGSAVALIAKNVNPTLGTFPWLVGDCLKGRVTAGSHYKILIMEKSTGKKDKSNGSFTISQ